MPDSEISRIKKQIQQECETMYLALNGYASVARHQIVAHKYRQISDYQDKLAQLIGDEEAQSVVIQTYIQTVQKG